MLAIACVGFKWCFLFHMLVSSGVVLSYVGFKWCFVFHMLVSSGVVISYVGFKWLLFLSYVRFKWCFLLHMLVPSVEVIPNFGVSFCWPAVPSQVTAAVPKGLYCAASGVDMVEPWASFTDSLLGVCDFFALERSDLNSLDPH